MWINSNLSVHVSIKQKPRILTTYTVTITRRGKKFWISKLLCWGLDFIFFAQSLTQSIGLCVYAKSSNTRLAASSDAFCAYAVWFFFDAMVCLGWLCVTDASCCTHSGTLNYVSLRLLNVNCHYLWVVSTWELNAFPPSLTDQCDRPVKWLVLHIIHLLTLGLP